MDKSDLSLEEFGKKSTEITIDEITLAIVERIRKITSGEFAEVRHGSWVALSPCRGYTEEFMCSECNAIVYLQYAVIDCDYDFCPHCGAKMDAGGLA